MPDEQLGHHEVDVARLGRVRLPRVRAVASATTIGLLIGGTAVPVLADSRTEQGTPAASEACPPWRCAPPTDGHDVPPEAATPVVSADEAAPVPADDAVPAEDVTPPAPADDLVVPVPAGEALPAEEMTPPAPSEDLVVPVPAGEAVPVPAEEVTPPAPADDPVAPVPAEHAVPVPAEDAAPVPAEDAAPVPAEDAAPVEPAPGSDVVAQDERGTRVGAEAYFGFGGGAEVVYNDERARVTVELGYGRDSSWGLTPDTAMPPTGPSAEASVTGNIPGTTVGGRATVTVDANGVSTDAQYNSGIGRTGIGAGPDGMEAPEARLGSSIPGARRGPLGAHVSGRYTFEIDRTPAPAPDYSKLDSDGDGYTDGSLQESPEVGGRQGMNPAGTARSPLDSDMDGVMDRSDRTIGRDSDEDGVADDIDQKPGDVDVDRDSDGVADQFDGDISASPPAGDSNPDSDGDGNSDGSFAESPEIGGRGDESSYGADQSAPAADAGDGGGAQSTPDSDGDGFSDGSFAESPEMGGRGDESGYGADQSAPAGDTSDVDAATGSVDTGSGDADAGSM